VTVRQALGPDRAERVHRAGRALPTSSVLALARRVLGFAPDQTEPPAAWPTPREREVAALIAAGHTNREIAKTLGISEKTIEAHVRNTMSKLIDRDGVPIYYEIHGSGEPTQLLIRRRRSPTPDSGRPSSPERRCESMSPAAFGAVAEQDHVLPTRTGCPGVDQRSAAASSEGPRVTWWYSSGGREGSSSPHRPAAERRLAGTPRS
jgi:hypothetical protein